MTLRRGLRDWDVTMRLCGWNGRGVLDGENGNCRLAPFERGADLGDSVGECEHPEREMGMGCVVGAAEFFKLLEGGEEAAVFLLEFAEVGYRDRGWGGAAEEQLEQKLIARRVVAVWDCEPGFQAAVAGFGE